MSIDKNYKMDLIYKDQVIGFLTKDNKLFVNSENASDWKVKTIRRVEEFSPGEITTHIISETKDPFNLKGEELSTFEIFLPINFGISIETSYDSNLKRYINVAVIRDNTPTEFPTNN